MSTSTEKRLGVIAVIIEDPQEIQAKVNELISASGRIVIGRMGIPHWERNIATLALIVEGTENEINTLTGGLGNLPGVSARAIMAKKS